MSEQKEQKVWFITGCSSGFGHQFALEALSRNDFVIATARNATSRPSLNTLKQKGAHILDLDVTSPKVVIDKVVQEAIAVYGRIDVLVNNAGYVGLGVCEELTQESLLPQLQTNFFSILHLTSSLLPHFRSRNTGTIAFIGSIFGHYSMPLLFPYAASKHLLAAYNESLRCEVSPFGVKTILFDIGHFRTEVGAHMKMVEAESGSGGEGKLDVYDELRVVVEGIKTLVHGHQQGDVEKGVAAMVDFLKEEGAAGEVLRGKKEWPLRVPVGGDAMVVVRGRGEESLKGVEEWESIMGGEKTDVEGVTSAKANLERTGSWRPELWLG